MKIQDSAISMSSNSSSFQSFSKTEHLKAWGNGRTQIMDSKTNDIRGQLNRMDILELSERAKEEMKALREKLGKENLNVEVQDTDEVTDEFKLEITDKDRAKLLLVKAMLEKLTGKEIKILIPEELKLPKPSYKLDSIPVDLKNVRVVNPSGAVQQLQGWGVEYNQSESYYENQQMKFSSEGIVKTSDGREISFSIDLSMSREFVSQKNISFRAGDAMLDPLIINFDGPAASLTDRKFSFDLDADGDNENISFATGGSGFLAVDKNSDGKINDGSELFGTKSGNGFADLAKYDGDNNGWIDENDAIYDKLRIWTKDANGEDKLFALGVKGVGAIYLGNVQTDFELKNNQNDTEGAIRRTGIFLRENGSVGTIQHVDLTV